jgi:hypothetical protein
MPVTTRFIGRLGNSMFQLAACIGYAKKYGYAWAAPADARESSVHQVFPNLPKTSNSPNAFPKRTGYDPEWFDYRDLPNVGPDVMLTGYWQSWKYFDHCKDEVKKVFQLDINPIDAISIHVRRGDYVTYANSFPPITKDYVREADNAIYDRDKSSPYKYIMFSDDIEWCKKEFRDWHDYVDIEYSEGRTEREDLSLMASCKHHIIANSSFSWWGAYLGHNPDKIVVTPHEESWYGPDNGVTKWYRENNKPLLPDLLPPEWIRIKFR